MARLIAHIGTHKTGSTAIQRAMLAHAGDLERQGIFYVPLTRETLPLETSTEFDPGAAAAVRAALLESLPRDVGDRTVVISSEAFSGDVRTGYENAPVMAEFLRAVTDGFETTVVVYLRRQDSFVESAYAQLIHMGGTESFEEYLAGLPAEAFDWHRLVSTFARRFGADSIVVRRYDRSVLPEHTSILDDFATVIGADTLPPAPGQESPNRGYSRDALEVARVCNRYLDKDQRHRLRLMLQATSAKEPFEPYSFFTGEERRRFLERFEESNARVAEEFVRDGAPLFPDTAIPPGSDYPGLTVETMARVLSRAMTEYEPERPRESGFIRRARGLERAVSRSLDRVPWLKRGIKRVLRAIGLA